MRLSRVLVALLAATPLLFLGDVSVVSSPDHTQATVRLSPPTADALFLRRAWDRVRRGVRRAARRIGRGVRHAWRRVKRGVRRAARRIGHGVRHAWRRVKRGVRRGWRGIKRGARRVGRAVKRGVKHTVGQVKRLWRKIRSLKGKVRRLARKLKKAVRKGFGKIKSLVKRGLRFARRLKSKVVNRMKRFGQRIVKRVKARARKALAKVVSRVAGRLGFTADDLRRFVDLRTGRIREQEVRRVILERIMARVKPIMQDKIAGLVDRGLRLVKKPLDAAVSAVIGGLGSIPFAGGAIAAAAHAAYSLGIDRLRKFAKQKLSHLVVDRLVQPLLRRGLSGLSRLGGPVRAAVRRLVDRARSFLTDVRKTTCEPQAM